MICTRVAVLVTRSGRIGKNVHAEPRRRFADLPLITLIRRPGARLRIIEHTIPEAVTTVVCAFIGVRLTHGLLPGVRLRNAGPRGRIAITSGLARRNRSRTGWWIVCGEEDAVSRAVAVLS